jgi:hypothetical protein
VRAERAASAPALVATPRRVAADEHVGRLRRARELVEPLVDEARLPMPPRPPRGPRRPRRRAACANRAAPSPPPARAADSRGARGAATADIPPRRAGRGATPTRRGLALRDTSAVAASRSAWPGPSREGAQHRRERGIGGWTSDARRGTSWICRRITTRRSSAANGCRPVASHRG